MSKSGKPGRRLGGRSHHVWAFIISSFMGTTGWTKVASYFLPLSLTSTVTPTPHRQPSPQTLNPSFYLNLNFKLFT